MDVLAVADAPEVGFLVVGDVVVQGYPCPVVPLDRCTYSVIALALDLALDLISMAVQLDAFGVT